MKTKTIKQLTEAADEYFLKGLLMIHDSNVSFIKEWSSKKRKAIDWSTKEYDLYFNEKIKNQLTNKQGKK